MCYFITYTVLSINVDIGPRGAQDNFDMNNNKIYEEL